MGLLASSLGLLVASWEHLGGLLRASWGGLAGPEAEKWPWLTREHDFVSSQGASWAEKWLRLEREQEFPKVHETLWRAGGCSKSGGVRPPQKLLAKAKSGKQ